ncbi:MAG: phosphatase PAP2 family protein [Clostridiales bacterium]|nr:phosphatase PAP2 family protein [Clostridiales bacterium]
MEFLRLLEGLRTPFFNTVFQFFTLFGEETVFMIVAMTFFWCINKKTGYFLLYVCFFGNIVNSFLKLVFLVPRPWVLDKNFTIVESARAQATGYSFPSGHTQNSAGLFLGVARARKELWIRIVCVAVTLLVGFSRMYLGVHTPADVLVSLGVALLLVLVGYPLFQRAWDKPGWFGPLVGVLLAAAVAIVLFIELVPMPAGAIEQFSLECNESAYKMVGAAFGLALVLWIEQAYIRFSEKAVWWAQVLKVALGLAVVIAVRLLLKEPLLAVFGGHNAAHAVRYFLMVVIGGALWPLTFRFFGKLGQHAKQA